jgi:hypothetical protein
MMKEQNIVFDNLPDGVIIYEEECADENDSDPLMQ